MGLEIFLNKILSLKKRFGLRKNLKKKFGSEIFFGFNKCVSKKNLGSKIFLGPINLLVQKFCALRNIGAKEILGPQTILGLKTI